MRAILRPALLGVIGLGCLLKASSILNCEGDVTSASVYRVLELLAWLGLGTSMVGIVWACIIRRRPLWFLDLCFCSAVLLFAVMTFIWLPSYIYTTGSKIWAPKGPNKTLLATVRSRLSHERSLALAVATA